MDAVIPGLPTMKGDRMLNYKMVVYPEENSRYDNVGEKDMLKRVKSEFGVHCIRGTALAFHRADENVILSMEETFRDFLKDKEIHHIVEIGTFRGVSTALLAHYADSVTTIDVNYYPEPALVWHYFGVIDKIRYCIVDSNEAKAELLNEMDFDFAFIDGMHTWEDVKLDYALTKKSGRVLFHDYDMKHCPGVTQFINCLPKEEIKIEAPFAYWEGNGYSTD